MSHDKIARQKRAVSQTLYLLAEDWAEDIIKYQIMGTTGNVYNVCLDTTKTNKPFTCSCPDYKRRLSNCKHIYFVEYKVLGTDNNNNNYSGLEEHEEVETKAEKCFRLARQRYREPCDFLAPQIILEEFNGIEENNNNSSSINGTATSTETISSSSTPPVDLSKQRDFIGEPCAICFDDMTEACNVIFCKDSCGNSVHKQCFINWMEHNKKNLCPHCRHPIDMNLFGCLPKKRKRSTIGGGGYRNLKTARYL